MLVRDKDLEIGSPSMLIKEHGAFFLKEFVGQNMSRLLFLSLCDNVNPFSAYKVYYLQNTYYTNKLMASSRNLL